MSSHEDMFETLDFGKDAETEIRLPKIDSEYMTESLLYYAARLPEVAFPHEVEKTAYGIKLDPASPGSGLGRAWNRYTNLAIEYSRQDGTPPSAELSFKSPQKYDGIKLIYKSDRKAWMQTTFDKSRRSHLLSHDEVLSILMAKLDRREDLKCIRDDTQLDSDHVPELLADLLTPHGNSNTQRRTYTASSVEETDAYICPIIARLSQTEGAHAVDYHISLEVQGIPIMPASYGNNALPEYISHVYEHVASVPYDADEAPEIETRFSVVAGSTALNQEYIEALVKAKSKEPAHAKDALKRAFALIDKKYLNGYV